MLLGPRNELDVIVDVVTVRVIVKLYCSVLLDEKDRVLLLI